MRCSLLDEARFVAARHGRTTAATPRTSSSSTSSDRRRVALAHSLSDTIIHSAVQGRRVVVNVVGVDVVDPLNGADIIRCGTCCSVE